MSGIDSVMDTILDGAGVGKIFTYPGTSGKYIYEYILELDDVELTQGVREQHLLYLAQTRYYRKVGKGEEEIPIVVVSGGMGGGNDVTAPHRRNYIGSSTRHSRGACLRPQGK
ncbi:MAG: thiamine pyrophosphate-binding protein [Candidatus Nanohaloarchaea archaeon]